MSLIEKKKQLRITIAHEKRCCLAEHLKAESQYVVNLIERSDVFLNSQCVLAYWPMNDEVDISALLDKWSDTKTFLLPCVVGPYLELRKYNGQGSLAVGKSYGILEPVGDVYTQFDNIDLVLVPGVAFDNNGNRLGRGAGYYDKLLPQLFNAHKAGVAFSFQMVQDVPCEQHDEVMNSVFLGIKKTAL